MLRAPKRRTKKVQNLGVAKRTGYAMKETKKSSF
jgi:hypothetical protein